MLNKTKGVTIQNLVNNFETNIFKLIGATKNITAVVEDQLTSWDKINYTKRNGFYLHIQ